MKELILLLGMIVKDENCIPRFYCNDTNGSGIRLQMSKMLIGDPAIDLNWNQNIPGCLLRVSAGLKRPWLPYSKGWLVYCADPFEVAK